MFCIIIRFCRLKNNKLKLVLAKMSAYYTNHRQYEQGQSNGIRANELKKLVLHPIYGWIEEVRDKYTNQTVYVAMNQQTSPFDNGRLGPKPGPKAPSTMPKTNSNTQPANTRKQPTKAQVPKTRTTKVNKPEYRSTATQTTTPSDSEMFRDSIGSLVHFTRLAAKMLTDTTPTVSEKAPLSEIDKYFKKIGCLGETRTKWCENFQGALRDAGLETIRNEIWAHFNKVLESAYNIRESEQLAIVNKAIKNAAKSNGVVKVLSPRCNWNRELTEEFIFSSFLTLRFNPMEYDNCLVHLWAMLDLGAKANGIAVNPKPNPTTAEGLALAEAPGDIGTSSADGPDETSVLVTATGKTSSTGEDTRPRTGSHPTSILSHPGSLHKAKIASKPKTLVCDHRILTQGKKPTPIGNGIDIEHAKEIDNRIAKEMVGTWYPELAVQNPTLGFRVKQRQVEKRKWLYRCTMESCMGEESSLLQILKHVVDTHPEDHAVLAKEMLQLFRELLPGFGS
jgi:hypothetical protein